MNISAVEVSVRGVRCPVLTAGPPDGAEVVGFVHGNLEDARPGRGLPGNGRPPGVRMLLSRENPRLTRDQIDRIYDAFRSWATIRAVLEPYRATSAATLAGPAAALRSLDRPALVILGDPGRLPALRAGRAPARGVELLEGHGHWAILEDPGRVASLVVPLLRRQLPGPATATGSPASQPPSS